MGCWNLTSVVLEYQLLAHIYSQFPGLAEKKDKFDPSGTEAEQPEPTQGTNSTELKAQEVQGKLGPIGRSISRTAQSWRSYMNHKVKLGKLLQDIKHHNAKLACVHQVKIDELYHHFSSF